MGTVKSGRGSSASVQPDSLDTGGKQTPDESTLDYSLVTAVGQVTVDSLLNVPDR